jgi:L-ascorbate metabolism protein UlaG (beta-lactamase superfamily)
MFVKVASTSSTKLAHLASLPLATQTVALWWLGQAGFALRGDGVTLLLDPFLSAHRHRIDPPAFAADQAAGIDAVLISHEHIDHLDGPSIPGIAAASPDAAFIVPTPIAPQLRDRGVPAERIIDAQPGEAVRLGRLTVHPVPAAHGVHVSDAYNFGRELSGGLTRYLGYVVELSGVRVYHAGDTIPYEGMTETIRGLKADLALLPINGRDRFREAQDLVGNMDHREAAQLAAEAGVDLLVPMHYEMFPSNLGFPAHLVEIVRRNYPDLNVLVPGKSRPFVYAPGALPSG